MHPEIVGDRLDGHPGIAVAGDPDNVVTELFRIRPGYNDILPAHPARQANSDVTYPCSRPHKRGKAFEGLLTDLFLIFDMEPRLSYSLAHEQIDGSLSFDTDDYIVEARWRQESTGREHLDVFKTKVERKGRNALGIFVSVNTFSADALVQYGSSSPFVVFTGDDLFMVLDGRIGLDDLLRAKKRHVNETGDCNLPARSLVL
ncbi:restriction endonuclease [Mycobacterium sp. P7213]|uniref:restriction endonuclease n=1 Tax=Mycobacterium sp. P7213 TaxID=2478465 RepID=UPI001F154701|nr:restriction endonuclease [Mycobacterium sp. P7213]